MNDTRSMEMGIAGIIGVPILILVPWGGWIFLSIVGCLVADYVFGYRGPLVYWSWWHGGFIILLIIALVLKGHRMEQVGRAAKRRVPCMCGHSPQDHLHLECCCYLGGCSRECSAYKPARQAPVG